MKRDSPRQSNDSEPEKEWSPLELAEMKTGRRIGQIRRPAGFSGRKRMKIEDQAACYHVMSRTVNGELLFGSLEKEAFRRMMWRMAQFSGVEILTYALMDNHFHILLKVPCQEKWLRRFEGPEGEEKLLTHLSTVYSKAFLTQLRRELGQLRELEDEEGAQVLLARFKKRFCDMSLFVKELKERFTRWYNKQNGRLGTLWMDRFKSVIVQNGKALETMAAYIDLNPVRAGLVDDPALSEWTGYGEAMSGSRRARRGLCKVVDVPQDAWEGLGQNRYRTWLYADGVVVPEEHAPGSKGRKKKGFTMKQMVKVRAEQEGAVSALLLIRKRISSFSNGVAVGSEDFVKEMAARYQTSYRRLRQKTGSKLGENETDKEQVYVMRE
jgi:putative transposase